jgi:site-specific DNA-methyltransferase (adenine-specific)
MTLHYEGEGVTLHHGDCIEVMRSLPDNSVHAIVTDPPYGLGFMGRAWDDLPPGLDFAIEAFRLLKPGGYILAFGGSRTWHRLAVAVEDAGFEIRDSIAWLYGSGFPKSLDVSKAIESRERGELVRSKLLHFVAERGIDGKWLEGQGIASAASFTDWTTGGHVPSEKNWSIVKGALGVTPEEEAIFERDILDEGTSRRDDGTVYGLGHSGRRLGGAVTPDAATWEGWGTALKPAFEPIVVGRKPLGQTVAANVIEHGTGALNIDGCRVSGADALVRPSVARDDNNVLGKGLGAGVQVEPAGRWPTNVLLDDSQAESLDAQTGILTSGLMKARTERAPTRGGTIYGAQDRNIVAGDTYADSGGASRFFPTFHYEAKAPGNERPNVDGVQHPTVKPLDLMRWLVRLVTPPGGTVLEPFAGSGTTLEACLIEGFEVIGIEREADYLPLIMKRITKPLQVSLFGEAIA